MATTDAAAVSLCKRQRAVPVAPRRRLYVCLVLSSTLLLLLALAAAVLSLTVLRPRPADASVTSFRLASLAVSPTQSLNATLSAVVSIRNPNPLAAFAHTTGRAEVYYRGTLAANADVPPGRVAAGGTEVQTVYLTVLADRIVGYAPRLYNDVVGAGVVPLTVQTAVPGTVTVLGLMRRRVVVFTVCNVAVSVRRPGVQNTECQYWTKL